MPEYLHAWIERQKYKPRAVDNPVSICAIASEEFTLTLWPLGWWPHTSPQRWRFTLCGLVSLGFIRFQIHSIWVCVMSTINYVVWTEIDLSRENTTVKSCWCFFFFNLDYAKRASGLSCGSRWPLHSKPSASVWLWWNPLEKSLWWCCQSNSKVLYNLCLFFLKDPVCTSCVTGAHSTPLAVKLMADYTLYPWWDKRLSVLTYVKMCRKDVWINDGNAVHVWLQCVLTASPYRQDTHKGLFTGRAILEGYFMIRITHARDWIARGKIPRI